MKASIQPKPMYCSRDYYYSSRFNQQYEKPTPINVHVKDQNLTEREAIQLVKEFTAERACNEVEFYMGMIADDQQTFNGLVSHLKNAFQSGETMSGLISNLYGCHEIKNESEDVFVDDLQILVRKIIAHKPSSASGA